MKHKKRILCQTLHAVGLLKLARLRASNTGQRLLVLAYHRIRGITGNRAIRESGPAFDEQVFTTDVSSFRGQMKWLSDNTTLLSEGDLIEALRSGRKLPSRATLITFDDGYRDNYTVAFPILRELGIPALFFIPTLAIEKREVGWWDLIAYAVKQKAAGTSPDAQMDVFALIRRHQLEYSSLPSSETSAYLARLFEDSGVSPPPLSLQSRELMSWEEIAECRRNGISIGSHTHRHRVLSRLSLAEQREELRESRRILERRLNVPVHSVAYPVGGYEHIHRETPELARECGFELGFSFRTGSNHATLDPFDIRRAPPPPSLPELATWVEFPELMAPRSCALEKPVSVLG